MCSQNYKLYLRLKTPVWSPGRVLELYPELTGDTENRLRSIFQEICDNKDLRLVETEIKSHEVWLSIASETKEHPSLLANWFKGISKRRYNKRYEKPELKWSKAEYTAFTNDGLREYGLV